MEDEQIFEECRFLSIMGPKLRALIKAARQCVDVPGEVVEVGSYRGGSGLALSRVFTEKKVFMIDTFTGIPADDVHESGHKRGDFSDTSINTVQTMLCDKAANNTILIPQDIRTWAGQSRYPYERLAFVHIDADIEQSTRAAVSHTLNRLNGGGGMFFDDYGNKRCPGVKPVVDALMATGKFTMTLELGTVFLKLT